MSSHYNEQFYKRQQSGSFSAAQISLQQIQDIIPINSVTDFGCGVGTWLSAAEDIGANRLIGLDGPWVKKERLKSNNIELTHIDLNNISFNNYWVSDLAVCVEVAEHLETSKSRHLVEVLTKTSKHIIFSAACPDQGGPGHVNEQWPSFWFSLFKDFGYVPIDLFRPALWDISEIPFWYRQNLFLLAPKSSPFFDALAARGSERNLDHPIDCVHPELLKMWKKRAGLTGTVRTIISRSLQLIR
jgi:SAM-dependent methyltransferase